MTTSAGFPITVRSDTMLRFLESDYETLRLTVNDPTAGYWLKSFAPENPTWKQEYVDPDRTDGQHPVEASRKRNMAKVVLTVHLEGTSRADLSAKVSALLTEVNRYGNKLEYKPAGWERSQVYTTYPVTGMDYSQWWRSAMQENDRLVDLRIELDAEPWAEYGGEQERLPILKSLGLNDNFEYWTAGVPDDWDIIIEGFTTVTEETSVVRSGSSAARISQHGGSSAEFKDSDYLLLDEDSYHAICPWVYCESGTGEWNFNVYIECYDETDALLGTVTVWSGLVPYQVAYAVWHDPCELHATSRGVISASDSQVTTRWLEGTAKIKRRIIFDEGDNDFDVILDAVHFSATDHIADHHPSANMVINVVPGIAKGDTSAFADFYFDKLYGTVNKLAIGQKKKYASGFSPIKGAVEIGDIENIGGADVVHSPSRYRQKYRAFNIPGNLITNDPGLNTYTGTGSEAEWTHWVKHVENDDLIEASTLVVPHYGAPYEGAAEPRLYTSNYLYRNRNVWMEYGYYIAVDPEVKHYLALTALKEITMLSDAPLYVWLKCYDATPTLLGSLRVFMGQPPLSKYAACGGYVNPVGGGGLAFPAGTTQVKPSMQVYGRNTGLAWQRWGYVMLQQATRISECSFDVEAHRGEYIPFMNLAASGAVTASDQLTLRARIAWDDEEASTQGYAVEATGRLGNPNTKFFNTLWGPQRFGQVTVPNDATPDDADNLEERYVLETEPLFDNTKDIRQDLFGLMPVDGAFLEATDLDYDHLIVNCTAKKPALLVSSDGTLATSKVVSPLQWKPSPRFTADPQGMNMVICMVHETDEDEAWVIPDIEMRYRPRVAIMTEG